MFCFFTEKTVFVKKKSTQNGSKTTRNMIFSWCSDLCVCVCVCVCVRALDFLIFKLLLLKLETSS